MKIVTQVRMKLTKFACDFAFAFLVQRPLKTLTLMLTLGPSDKVQARIKKYPYIEIQKFLASVYC